MQKTTLFLLSLFLIIIFFLSSCDEAQYIEIYFKESPAPAFIPEVFIAGQVNTPGIYPLMPEDTLQDLLEAAGGIKGDNTILRSYVYFAIDEAVHGDQKVDINRASSWLLQALPGIGEVTAHNIIEYRNENGIFRHIKEIMYVKGIGEATFKNISDKITVADFHG